MVAARLPTTVPAGARRPAAPSRRQTIGPGFDELLSAAQSGAGWACTRIYETFAPAVAGYFRLHGAREPEDLTSEVFLAVFTRAGTFSGNEVQFRSWIFTIAHHRLVDERRALSRAPALHPLDHADGWSSAPAEDEAMRRLAVDRVRDLLTALTPDQRDVLTLRVLGQFEPTEVARIIDKPAGAVKALQRRGLAALRRQLCAQGGRP